MIRVPAHIAQDDGRTPQLRHNQVRRAVAIHVRRDDIARVVQVKLVEAQLPADIFPAVRAEIAEYVQLCAVLRFQHRRQIHPSVIVEVDGRDTVAADDALRQRQRHALEVRAFYIAPQRQAGRAVVGHGHIHPAIFVEVENGHAPRRRQRLAGKRHRPEGILALVKVDCRRAARSRHHKVHRAIVVDVRQLRLDRASLPRQPLLRRYIGKGRVAVVPPHDIGAGFSPVDRPSRHEQIQIAVVIEVHKRQPYGIVLLRDAHLRRHVLEMSATEVVIEDDAPAAVRPTDHDGQIRLAVVVVIADRAGHAHAAGIEASLARGNQLERPIVEVFIDRNGMVPVRHRDQILRTRSEDVHHASATASPRWSRKRLGLEFHRNHRHRCLCGESHFFHRRKMPAVAVAERQRRGDFRVHQVLELCHFGVRRLRLPGALESARKPELRRGVVGIDGERRAKLRNRLRQMAQAH